MRWSPGAALSRSATSRTGSQRSRACAPVWPAPCERVSDAASSSLVRGAPVSQSIGTTSTWWWCSWRAASGGNSSVRRRRATGRPGPSRSRARPRAVDLCPGDALYVPLGLSHRARAGARGSLHLSITIRELSVRDALSALSTSFAEQMPPGARLTGHHRSRQAEVRRLLDRVAHRAEAADAAEVLAALERAWVRPAPRAPVALDQALSCLAGAEPVRPLLGDGEDGTD
ncbi:MAG: Cupin superfamily protein [Chloroflexi bacterium]|nr:Cupin superfamily protein [Chloroflexota bacterium]